MRVWTALIYKCQRRCQRGWEAVAYLWLLRPDALVLVIRDSGGHHLVRDSRGRPGQEGPALAPDPQVSPLL